MIWEKTTFDGLEGYAITSGIWELIVISECGPRIAFLGEKGGDNLLYWDKKGVIRGEYHLMFTGLQTSEYEKSLEKLNKEAARAGHIEQCKTGIDAMISAAQQKAARQAESANKKSMDIFR